MARIWDDLLSAEEKMLIAKSGIESTGAPGWTSRGTGKRPAAIVVDMQERVFGPDAGLLEAVKSDPVAMGRIAWQAVAPIYACLSAARRAGVPILYTRSIPSDHHVDEPSMQIIGPLAPQPEDLIIDKQFASAFHGTVLATTLVRLGADTTIVVGNSTSGCVRATAVDAQQHGYRVVVPEECVFDRIAVSHRASLLDLWMKYAEVLPLADVIVYLESLNTHASRR